MHKEHICDKRRGSCGIKRVGNVLRKRSTKRVEERKRWDIESEMKMRRRTRNWSREYLGIMLERRYKERGGGERREGKRDRNNEERKGREERVRSELLKE